MRPKKKIKPYDGPLAINAPLPDYVRARLTQPWAATRDDRFLQKLYAGYFVVVNPEAPELKEIWTSEPPGNRRAMEFVKSLKVIDDRVLIAFMQKDPNRQYDAKEYLKVQKALRARIEAEKEQQSEDRILADEDFAESFVSDSRHVGRYTRPVRSIIVPDNLVRRPPRQIIVPGR